MKKPTPQYVRDKLKEQHDAKSAHEYISDRVFDGIRPISPKLLAKLKARLSR